MMYRAQTLADLTRHGFDTVIDVRSPQEFAEDHLPGAINLPVLDDAERARVGTLYRASPFEARKIGAALVARRAAGHLETALAGHGGGWRPLVHCWRGGQRSGAFATILRDVGWRVSVLEGGYRTWRRLVTAALHEGAWPTPVVVLDGDTGTAKTELLHLLAARGVQVLDLEGMAAHRGSLLGDLSRPQPSQKAFEGALAAAMPGFDPDRPVVVEAESSKVGAVQVPAALWTAMKSAPRIGVAAPVAARAAYLARVYADIAADPDRLRATLGKLRTWHGGDRVEAWQRMARDGALADLAGDLCVHHYDPRYARSRARHATDGPQPPVLWTDGLDDASLALLADRIAAMLPDGAVPATGPRDARTQGGGAISAG